MVKNNNYSTLHLLLFIKIKKVDDETELSYLQNNFHLNFAENIF